MVLNWLFDSSDEQSEAEKNGNPQDKLLVTGEQNYPSKPSTIDVEDLSQNNVKEQLMSVQKINPENGTDLERVEANSEKISSNASFNLGLTANNLLRSINQEAQELMEDGLNKIRQSLQADRVLVYGFNPDGSGKVLAESVDSRWSKAGSSFDRDYFITENNCKPYYVVNDISTKDFALCFREALEALEAKAYISVPIQYNNELLGFLSAYQNSGPRNWQESEVQMMLKCAVQFCLPLQQTTFIRHSQFQEQQREKATKRERSLAQMLDQIRNAKDEERILQIATYEGRKLLEADRLAIYRFDEDWSGRFIAESVVPGWSKLIDTVLIVKDTFLQENQGGRYKYGECFAVDDIYMVGHQACHIALLEQFEARAYVIAPIFIGDMATDKKLWGLVAVYQNSGSRKWQEEEIELLRQIGLQVGIGIQQNRQFEELQKTVVRQRSLSQMVDRMQNASSLENVLEIAAQETRKLLGVERSSIYRFNPDWSGANVVEAPLDQDFKSLQDSCFLTTFANNSYPYLQKNQGGRYKNGESSIVSDVRESNLEERLIEVLERLDIKAYVRIPIFVEQKLWGIINIYQSRTCVWQEEDLEFLKRIVVQVGIIIQQKQNLEALQTQAQQEKALSNIVQRIGGSLKLQDIFRSATQEVRQLLQVDRAVVYRFNPDWTGEVLAESAGLEWVSVMEIQETDETLFNKEMNANEQCTLKNMQASSALDEDTYLISTQGGNYTRGKKFNVVNDIYAAGFSSCYLKSLEKYQARAYIIVPIFQNEKLWGLFAVYQNSGTREWNTNELNLMLQIAPQLGIAIEQAGLLDKLRSQEEKLSDLVARERSERENLQQGALRVLKALEPSFRGDLTVRAPLSEDEIGTIADGYNTTIQNLRQLVRQVQVSASRVSETSSYNSQSVAQLSNQAQKTSGQTPTSSA